MNKMRVYAVLLAFVMLLSACGAKNNVEATQPALNNATTEATVAETEYVVPDVPGLDRNAFSTEEFEEAQIETTPKETTTEDTESQEKEDEIPATSEVLEFEEGTSPESNVGIKSETEYQRYMAMSGTDQKAFIESFDSMEAFFEWLDGAKAYDDSINGAIIVEGDTIDLGKIQ